VSDPLGGLDPAPPPDPGPAPVQARGVPATPTTVVLLALLGAGFAAQIAIGGGIEFDELAAFQLGSLMPAAVADGDFYRLGSYAFLHGGALHLLVNAWALWVLMRPIESVLGPFAAMGIFSGAAIAGGAASLFWSRLRGELFTQAVGASGGLFGLFGAHCAIYLRVRKQLPPEARRAAARSLVANLLINLALAIGAQSKGILLDNAAHLGGFVSGMALGAIAVVPMLPARPWQRASAALFALCAFALAGMEGAAVARAVRPHPRTLRAPGAEAVVPWRVVPLEPGVAQTVDRQFEVQLTRAENPIEVPPGSKPVRLGNVDWYELRSQTSKGTPSVLLTAPGPRLVVGILCTREDCPQDVRDRLAEDVAAQARATEAP
jgi:rhomboid protease GluP